MKRLNRSPFPTHTHPFFSRTPGHSWPSCGNGSDCTAAWSTEGQGAAAHCSPGRSTSEKQPPSHAAGAEQGSAQAPCPRPVLKAARDRRGAGPSCLSRCPSQKRQSPPCATPAPSLTFAYQGLLRLHGLETERLWLLLALLLPLLQLEEGGCWNEGAAARTLPQGTTTSPARWLSVTASQAGIWPCLQHWSLEAPCGRWTSQRSSSVHLLPQQGSRGHF